MTDRVHPGGAGTDLAASEPLNPPPSYVIQVPKDQVYRVPPPENAYKFKRYTARARRRRHGCCFFLCWILAALLLLALFLGAAAAVLYLVYRPKLPAYSVDSLAVKGIDVRNATGPPVFSPEFDAVVRADNPNGKISIDYRGGSSLKLLHSGVQLAAGSWPAFLQGRKNTTDVPVALRGKGIRLSDPMLRELRDAQTRGAVPLRLDVEVPVRVRFGGASTWTVTVRARCDVTVDKLTENAKVTDSACGAIKVNIFS